LATVDVGNFEGRQSPYQPHLRLFTRNDTEIRWGTALGRERPYLEAPPRDKLERLFTQYAKYGSLDVYQYVDIRPIRKDRCDPLKTEASG
jgi:hypothetical protein